MLPPAEPVTAPTRLPGTGWPPPPCRPQGARPSPRFLGVPAPGGFRFSHVRWKRRPRSAGLGRASTASLGGLCGSRGGSGRARAVQTALRAEALTTSPSARVASVIFRGSSASVRPASSLVNAVRLREAGYVIIVFCWARLGGTPQSHLVPSSTAGRTL